jgi:hypothetical protein
VWRERRQLPVSVSSPKWRTNFSTSGTNFSTTNNNNSFYKPVRDDIPKLPRPPCSVKPRISPQQSLDYQQQQIVPNNKNNNSTASRDDDDEEHTPPNNVPTKTTITPSPSSILLQPMSLVEIQGMSLLEERDDCLKELQQANRIMYFHALQLIRKQKQWLKLASSSCSLFPPLSTHEQRQKALQDLESKIVEATTHCQQDKNNGILTLSPEKALFKATALLEDSMSCFFLKHYDSKRNFPTISTTTTTCTVVPPLAAAEPPTPAAVPAIDQRDATTLLKLDLDGNSSSSCSDVYYDLTIRDGGTVITNEKEGVGSIINSKPTIIFTDDDDDDGYDEWMKSIQDQRRRHQSLIKAVPGDTKSKDEESEIHSMNHLCTEFDEWKKAMEHGMKFPPATSVEEEEEEEQQSTEATPDSIIEGSDHYFSQFDDWMKDLQGKEKMRGHVGTTHRVSQILTTPMASAATAFDVDRIEI